MANARFAGPGYVIWKTGFHCQVVYLAGAVGDVYQCPILGFFANFWREWSTAKLIAFGGIVSRFRGWAQPGPDVGVCTPDGFAKGCRW